MKAKSKRSQPTYAAHEYKVVSLRECFLERPTCDTPEWVFRYWSTHVTTHPYYDPERECLVAILLDARHRAKGHVLVSIGTLSNVLMHAREVFRAAVVSSAAAVVLAHNHPSGDPSPSQEDLNSTRTMIQAGVVLGIHLLDHVIIGRPSQQNERGYVSLLGRGIAKKPRACACAWFRD